MAATTPLIAVYSSPTLRARETAEAVARASGLHVEPDERLREVYLGDESLGEIQPAERAAAVRERLAKLANIALTEGTWNAVPGAELGTHIRARMTSAVDDIVARHPEGHIAIVSHAGSINAYIATVLGIERDFFYPIGNTSLNTVRFYDRGPLIVRLNDTGHLESPLETEAGQTVALHRTAQQSV
jgi:broad specificity phosphatase PhoE